MVDIDQNYIKPNVTKCNISVSSLVNLMGTTAQKMKPAKEIWRILLTNLLL